MKRIVMKRGWKEVQENPSVDDVLNLMRIVEDDLAQEGPPDLALDCLNHDRTGFDVVGQLLFMLAFHPHEAPLWLVQFSARPSKLCWYLARQAPKSDIFCKRTSCGVTERFRQECLLERNELVREVIVWFLNNGTACPSLTWLQYKTVVRDADGLS
jgi:hypothetical protein